MREKQVFISHCSADKERAVEIVNMLERNHISCWLALRDIRAAENYTEQITEAIENCYVLVMICTDEAQKSDYVFREVDQAIRKNKFVIPYTLGNIPFRTSDSRFEFLISSSQSIEEIQGKKEAEARLREDVKDLIKKGIEEEKRKNKKLSNDNRNRIWSPDLDDEHMTMRPKSDYFGKTLLEMKEIAIEDSRECIEIHEVVQDTDWYNGEACLKLGNEYYFGKKIKKNIEKALYWFYQAARNGNAQAMYYLGELYRRGKGVQKSCAQAAYWYRQSIGKNPHHTGALCALGDFYRKGKGAEPDALKAAAFYLKAAKSEDPQTAEKKEDVLGTLRYMALINKCSPSDQERLQKKNYTLDRLTQVKKNRAMEIQQITKRAKWAKAFFPIDVLACLATLVVATATGINNCPIWEIPWALVLSGLSVLSSILLSSYFTNCAPMKDKQKNRRKFRKVFLFSLGILLPLAAALNLAGILAGDVIISILTVLYKFLIKVLEIIAVIVVLLIILFFVIIAG